MAKFAPVAPIQILESLKEEGILGDYHLLLTHHVLEFKDRFKALFMDHPQSTIIMDNSVVELGESQIDEMVLEACLAIQDKPHAPHWVIPVLSDVMSDGLKTREWGKTSYAWWQGRAEKWPLMVVLQGSTWEEFTKTADYFLLGGGYEQIEYVGIPRVLVEHLGTRQLAVQYIEAIRPDINVHLLGFSDDVTDDVITANHSSVEGIDSAVPIRYSFSGGEALYTPSADIPPRPADWFEKGAYDDSIWKNLEAIRRWVA